jgi:hypothetical protein
MARELRTSATNRTTAVFLSLLSGPRGGKAAGWGGFVNSTRLLYSTLEGRTCPEQLHRRYQARLATLAVRRRPAGWGHGVTSKFPVPPLPWRISNPDH